MLQRFTRSLFILAVACLSVAGVRDAAAQDRGAVAFVQNLGTQGMQLLGPGVPPYQRAALFRQLLQANFDLPEISNFVLGAYARSMTPQQRQEFVGLFADYLTQAYSSRLGQYAGASLQVIGARPYGGEIVVISQVGGTGQGIEADWHVVNAGGGYRVTDVVVGGVSMKASQRNEIAGIIQRNGGRPDAMMVVLRQQLGRR